jgi:hypothetical protein
MDWTSHPNLYQLCHPWHWLTYGQNAIALGIFIPLIVSVITIVVLIRTLNAVNAQAQAANRQAKAAEEQVAAAQAATAVSEAQRRAAEQSAEAARLQSELIRYEFLANLRPVLGVDKEINPRMTSTLQYWLINYGRGAALDIEATYRGKSMERIGVSANILGPDTRTQFAVNTDRAQAEGLQILYRSEDGRRFATTVTMNGNNFEAKTFQVDEKGGWLADPKVPGLTRD